MDHELGHNLRMKHDHMTYNAMARTSVVCTNLLLQIWASATAASITSTSYYISTERTACFINLSSKATLESHTVGIREWIKKKVIWLWQHPSLSKRLLLSALMRLKKGSDCALGSCCKNCKFLKVTTPCYLIADECDLQEYCNGTSKCCKQIPISKMAPLQITRLLLPGPVVRPRESAW